jgi:KEOPS complex subunit Cgi121
MANVTVVGIRCDRPFDDIVSHFHDLGGDVILFNPKYVFGRDHILSAVMHAERAFERGMNRSRSIITETILYTAGERQISKAIAKMRPADGCKELVAAVFDVDDICLDRIGAAVDNDLVKCTHDKIKGTDLDVPGVPPEDLALEMVAMMDIQKQ